MITAKIICDSINTNGNRLTTFELRYPKFIHGEFMTHRVFSRNASSSRAIPTKKLIEEVRSYDLRAAPVSWGKNVSGMQAKEELGEPEQLQAKSLWSKAANNAADVAEEMLDLGVHKQIVNRVLEPFSHINVVVTATEYMNFFGLRLDKDAQPEMRELAKLMWEEYNSSIPKKLEFGEWHLPYTDDLVVSDQLKEDISGAISGAEARGELNGLLIKVSVARCARVSYKSFETGKVSTIEEDLKLYDRLLSNQPVHASPAEHQATPDVLFESHLPKSGFWASPLEHGNFTGWRQYRKMLKGENMAPLPEEYNGTCS